MSFSNPGFRIPRRSIVGHEAMWAKMFDPPTESPPTPEMVKPTNPVPAFMAQAIPGAKESIPNTVRRYLLHGANLSMYDGKKVMFYTVTDPDVPLASGGSFPGPTIRIPRGTVFHCASRGEGPPPHTIHWHGIEPTPMNDGVGHCSFEIGEYTYQFQPNFIGTYFYHCHRNTVQHFEFGLYGALIVDAPDAYDPSDGKNVGGYPRRTAANLTDFPEFPGFVGGDLASGDPHAMTVPYDVEALWVPDDIDSAWRRMAPDARATYPKMGNKPGVDDNFHGNAGGGVGPNDFFAFHDFNPDYFVNTGVNFPGPVGGTATMPEGVVVPPDLNSGVSGMQVSVNARVDQTILIRVIDAAYINTLITFPLDVVIIGFDGRALGVPPFGQYNRPFRVKAGTPIELSVARRFDALMRSSTPIDDFAQIEFVNNHNGKTLMKGRVPIVVSSAAAKAPQAEVSFTPTKASQTEVSSSFSCDSPLFPVEKRL